ncbi:NAD-dependent epimerase/dehydratase family protein [Streptomyces sp. WELS2]|uniref:NAD-dependent epimerase/dehydratase family protein n=1 Tax=Streptomyces sp. WELS2 TaxID=2749435 RepID=UPI0015F0BD77|nr:NAD-dependent epimerase/dehydratase family protein [Streptomyces sp. WELS2]
MSGLRGDRPHTVLLTGGTGFIGSHVLARLLAAADRGARLRVRLLAHTAAPPAHPAVEPWTGDLADPATLRGICAGVSRVLHLGSLVSGDEDRLRAVNAVGTSALLDEARAAGVRSFVRLSTTAVYGPGPHRGVAEEAAVPGPESAVSRSRLAGDVRVLAAGGTVVRPHLVYGSGDTWVVPAAVTALRLLPGLPDDGRARVSVISADDLAEALVALALDQAGPPAGVLHAAHPEPVSVRAMLSRVAGELSLPLPGRALTADEAVRGLPAGDERAPRLIRFLTTDAWFDGRLLWRTTGVRPGAGFLADFPTHLPWYRKALGLS